MLQFELKVLSFQQERRTNIGMGIRSSIGIGLWYQYIYQIRIFWSNTERYPIHEPFLCYNTVSWHDAISDSWSATVLAGYKLWMGFPECWRVPMRHRGMRHPSFQKIHSTVLQPASRQEALMLTQLFTTTWLCVFRRYFEPYTSFYSVLIDQVKLQLW